MDKRKIIIDTDPGIDDAVALAIALHSNKMDVKLITTVCGNVGIEHVTNNTLKLLTFFGKDVPVAKGAYRPLINAPIDASNVHGVSGMDGYDFGEPNMNLLLPVHAVEALRTTLSQSKERMTIVAIGPLTNIALLLRLYPDLAEKIEELVMMGGTITRGNSGVLAEYNFHADPEAAKIVFESGIKIVVAPLDVGLKALIYPADSEKIKTMNKIGDMFYNLFKRYRGGSFGTGLKMYDGCAIAYLLCPDMFEKTEVHVAIETKSELTYGASLVDLRGYLNRENNAVVLTDIDEDLFKSWFFESIENCN